MEDGDWPHRWQDTVPSTQELAFLVKSAYVRKTLPVLDIWLLFKKLLEYSMRDKLYIQNNAWSFSSTKISNWGPLNCGLFSPSFVSSIRLISIEYHLLVCLFIYSSYLILFSRVIILEKCWSYSADNDIFVSFSVERECFCHSFYASVLVFTISHHRALWHVSLCISDGIILTECC